CDLLLVDRVQEGPDRPDAFLTHHAFELGHQGAVVPEDAATPGRQEDLRERTVALGMRAHSIRDDVAGRGRVVEDVLVGDPRSPDGRRRGKDQAEGQDGPSTDGYPSIRSTCRPPRKLFIDPATAPHIPRR